MGTLHELSAGTPWTQQIDRWGAFPVFDLSCRLSRADTHTGLPWLRWLRQADLDGSLAGFLHPCLTGDEHERAEIEGRILGIKRNGVRELLS